MIREFKIPLVPCIDREGERKFTPGHERDFLLLMPLDENDTLFSNAFAVFQKYFQICIEDRGEELSNRINAEIVAKARLGQIVDTISPRYPMWREHAKNIGEDFLAMYDSHIELYCNHISENSKMILFSRLNVIFEGLAKRREQEIIRVISSLGRQKEGIKSDTLVSNGIYINSIPKYRDLLDAKITKHNFEVSVRERLRTESSSGRDGVEKRQQTQPNNFGIPITKGKIRSTGESGIVVSFNLRQLSLNRLLSAQLYSSDQKPLTLTTLPHLRVTDIFNYPLLKSSVDFAFAQKEYTAYVFVNTPKLTFSEKVRIIFWFQRYPIPGWGDDKVDVPNEAIPLLTAEGTKSYLLHLGRPVPQELEKTIAEEEAKLKKRVNTQNYWTSDTFNLSSDELDGLDKDDEEIIAEEKKQKAPKTPTNPDGKIGINIAERNYSPNVIYQDIHHRRFKQLWDEQKSQELAYDILAKEYSSVIDINKFDSYIVRFRVWNKDHSKKRK